MSELKDFLIRNGVLAKYKGVGSDVVVPDGIVEIGYAAFLQRTDITSIIIPDSVTTIGTKAFMGCTNLRSVIMGKGVTNIKEKAFANCVGLYGIHIPNSVTSIGDWAFLCCASIENILLPNSVVHLGEAVFFNCYNLSNVVISANISRIKKLTFYDCKKLTNISIGGVNEIEQDAFKGCEYISLAFAPNVPKELLIKHDLLMAARLNFLINQEEYTDENTIKDYENYAFLQKKKLLPLIFKNDLVCGVEFYARTNKITMDNFETEFFRPAQDVNAKQCVAFLLDWKNQNVSAEDTEKHYKKQIQKDVFNVADMKKIWSFDTMDNNTIIIKGYKGDDTHIVIPERIGKRKVTAIKSDAFSYLKGGLNQERLKVILKLETITIGANVTEIGNCAIFTGNRTAIHAPAGSYAEKYAKENNIPFVAE